MIMCSKLRHWLSKFDVLEKMDYYKDLDFAFLNATLTGSNTCLESQSVFCNKFYLVTDYVFSDALISMKVLMSF